MLSLLIHLLPPLKRRRQTAKPKLGKRSKRKMTICSSNYKGLA
jgi:hypothetical protein